MTKPSDYLKKGWCAGNFAQDTWGYSVDSISDAAVSWCMLGALDVSLARGDILARYYYELLKTLFAKLEPEALHGPKHVISQWQDDKRRTHQEVVEMMQWAEKQILPA